VLIKLWHKCNDWNNFYSNKGSIQKITNEHKIKMVLFSWQWVTSDPQFKVTSCDDTSQKNKLWFTESLISYDELVNFGGENLALPLYTPVLIFHKAINILKDYFKITWWSVSDVFRLHELIRKRPSCSVSVCLSVLVCVLPGLVALKHECKTQIQ